MIFGKGGIMRRGFVLYSIILFLTAGICAQANVLENPGFEEGTAWIPLDSIPGWLNWGGSGGVHNDPGRTIDTQALMLWWTDSGLYQDFPAIAGHTYRFSGYMLHPFNDALREGDKTGEFRAEWYNATDSRIGTDIMFGQISKDDPTDTWLFYTADLTAPAGTAYGRYLIRMFQPTAGDGIVSYDDTSVYDLALYGQAYDPDPSDGDNVGLDLAALSWKNHDPNNPNDTIICDVYLDDDPNFLSPSMASGIITGTVLLSELDPNVVLVDDTKYYWYVDSTDPNTPGNPVTFPGVVWTFQVADLPPAVNAGDNQYLWIYMDDVDGEPNQVTFTITGTYTDDGKSPILSAEWIQGAHEGGGTVTILSQDWTPGPDAEPHTSGTVEAEINATANGWLFLTLEVTDSAGTGTDTMNVGVYNTCLEAAIEDPSDTTIEDNWPDGHGDIDGDCDTDLEDFALMASSWVNCMTVKAGCTP